MRYIAYTDGACSKNPGPGGWGAIVVNESTGEEVEYSGFFEVATNNRMEMFAAIRALEEIPAGSYVTLYTDSRYLASAFNEHWIDKWMNNGWRTQNRRPVLNQDLWNNLLVLVETRTVDFQWIKGHAGHNYNERVDQLARNEVLNNLPSE